MRHSTVESFLKKLDTFPDMLTTNDLISLGIYKNKESAYYARKTASSPCYIQKARNILYPKAGVRSFHLERFGLRETWDNFFRKDEC